MVALTQTGRFAIQHCEDFTAPWYCNISPAQSVVANPTDSAGVRNTTGVTPVYSDLIELIDDYGPQPRPYLFFPVGSFAFTRQESLNGKHGEGHLPGADSKWCSVTADNPASSQALANALNQGDRLFLRAEHYHVYRLKGIIDLVITRRILGLTELTPGIITVNDLAEREDSDAAQVWNRTALFIEDHLKNYFARYFALRGQIIPGGVMSSLTEKDDRQAEIRDDEEVLAAVLEVFNWSIELSPETNQPQLTRVVDKLRRQLAAAFAQQRGVYYRPATAYRPSDYLLAEMAGVRDEFPGEGARQP